MKKFIKYALIVLGIIALVVVAIGLAAPKKYDFKRSILIKADKKTVWNQVAYWKNFNNWSPWYEVDTAMAQSMEGTDGEKGGKYIWKSKKAGSGNMINTEMMPMDSRSYELHFDDFAGFSTCSMNMKDSAGGTFVTWSMKGETSFVPTIFMFFMGGMEGAVGKDFDKGLGYLKKYCEAHPEKSETPYKLGDIVMKKFPKTLFVQIKRDAKISEYEKNAGPWMQEMMGKIMGFVQANKLQMRGSMFSIYYTWDMKGDKTQFSVAVPIAKEGPAGTDGITYETLPGSECVTIDMWGDYSNSGKAHMAIADWMAKEKKAPTGATLEEYITDPSTEKDPMKWQTRVWYPIGK